MEYRTTLTTRGIMATIAAMRQANPASKLSFAEQRVNAARDIAAQREQMRLLLQAVAKMDISGLPALSPESTAESNSAA